MKKVKRNESKLKFQKNSCLLFLIILDVTHPTTKERMNGKWRLVACSTCCLYVSFVTRMSVCVCMCILYCKSLYTTEYLVLSTHTNTVNHTLEVMFLSFYRFYATHLSLYFVVTIARTYTDSAMHLKYSLIHAYRLQSK